jgi:hypothetical protein
MLELQTEVENSTFSFHSYHLDEENELMSKVKESLEALYEFQRNKTESYYNKNKKHIL